MNKNKWLVYYNEDRNTRFQDTGTTTVDLSEYRLVAQFDQKFEEEDSNLKIIVADNRGTVRSANVHTVNEGLNVIWAWMNLGSGQEIMPYWLCLRSMSVGDVIKDPDGTYWYCASVGWREVDEFSELPFPEQVLRNIEKQGWPLNNISIIKMIRQLKGADNIGLKEAKELSDELFHFNPIRVKQQTLKLGTKMIEIPIEEDGE